MGRGDNSTRKGKIFAGSFGNRRPHKHKRRSTAAPPRISRSNAPKDMPAKPSS